MNTMPDILPISELRQNAATVIKRMLKTNAPVFITQRGRASAVMLSAEAYERTMRELEILKALAQGEKDVSEGRTDSMDNVFADAERMIDQPPKDLR